MLSGIAHALRAGLLLGSFSIRKKVYGTLLPGLAINEGGLARQSKARAKFAGRSVIPFEHHIPVRSADCVHFRRHSRITW